MSGSDPVSDEVCTRVRTSREPAIFVLVIFHLYISLHRSLPSPSKKHSGSQSGECFMKLRGCRFTTEAKENHDLILFKYFTESKTVSLALNKLKFAFTQTCLQWIGTCLLLSLKSCDLIVTYLKTLKQLLQQLLFNKVIKRCRCYEFFWEKREWL